ncbi:CLUMA_CG016067, isoform A [Clunio marinus]|uniref:CLUMA_CG016067, isoform A n=1 Tax=Clunio marinus TaxID=568069 RepID=A0A1J1IQU2_9DIPT|nr:CLUMA_CG016067, isoform A [Clunio marinus]
MSMTKHSNVMKNNFQQLKLPFEKFSEKWAKLKSTAHEKKHKQRAAHIPMVLLFAFANVKEADEEEKNPINVNVDTKASEIKENMRKYT